MTVVYLLLILCIIILAWPTIKESIIRVYCFFAGIKVCLMGVKVKGKKTRASLMGIAKDLWRMAWEGKK